MTSIEKVDLELQDVLKKLCEMHQDVYENNRNLSYIIEMLEGRLDKLIREEILLE